MYVKLIISKDLANYIFGIYWDLVYNFQKQIEHRTQVKKREIESY